MHPAERYVGWEYHADTADCADLVIQVQREMFGRDVSLPNGKPRGNRGRAVMAATAAAQAAPCTRRAPDQAAHDRRPGEGGE